MVDILDYKDIHVGESCVIIGNGPSLKKYALNKINLPTFGLNRIYLRYIPTYFVVVQRLVLDQWHRDIARLDTYRFIPERYQDKYELDACWIKTKGGRNKRFQKNLRHHMWEGHTVTYVALQLAYWMGFSRVFMIGVDHDYGDAGEPNKVEVRDCPDDVHWAEDYFPEGFKWATPNLEKSTIAYQLAQEAYARNGREIYVSRESKLDLFPVYGDDHWRR